MPADLHDAMRHIVDKSLVGEASPQEQQSLREHLRACAQCEAYASEGRRAIAGLSGFSFAIDPDLQAKVHAALDQRMQQLQAAQPLRRRPGYQSIVQLSIAALLLTIVGSFGALHLGNPLAALLHLEPAQAQAGLLTFWIVPSWGFALLLPVMLFVSARVSDQRTRKDTSYEAS
jgi:anti-sigma factor RsiW